MHMKPVTTHPFALGTPLHIAPLNGGTSARIMFVESYEGEAILLSGLGPISGEALVTEVCPLAKLMKDFQVRPATAADEALIADMRAALKLRKQRLQRESGTLDGFSERLQNLE